MQSTYLNADGSAVKLTVAEIFWPVSNTCIHDKGIIGKSEGKILGVDKNEVYNKAFELLKWKKTSQFWDVFLCYYIYLPINVNCVII